MIKKNIIDQYRRIKLFGFLPIWEWTHKGGRKNWKVLGVPVYGRIYCENKTVLKHYVLGILVLKITKKAV